MVSPQSLESGDCQAQIEYTQQFVKRSLALICTAVERTEVIQEVTVFDFTAKPLGATFSKLLQTLDLDREHAHLHTILLQRAMEWDENDCTNEFLLNTIAYEHAHKWLDEALEEEKQPQPTDLKILS